MRPALLLGGPLLLLAASCTEPADQPPPTAAQATTQPTERPAATPVPTATASPPPDGHTWYTSGAVNARYYYCELDEEWRDLDPANLHEYTSEAALLDRWGGQRQKHPESAC